MKAVAIIIYPSIIMIGLVLFVLIFFPSIEFKMILLKKLESKMIIMFIL